MYDFWLFQSLADNSMAVFTGVLVFLFSVALVAGVKPKQVNF
jgi:hypothetical protein